MGSVYYGIRKSDNIPVALKLFGYTSRTPNEDSIIHEVKVMWTLRNVDGIVRLHGTFLDSPSGYVEGKILHVPRPILVMEYLAGLYFYYHLFIFIIILLN